MTHSMDTGYANEQPLTWKGVPGYRPLLLLIAAAVFTIGVTMPPPQSMLDMVTQKDAPGYKLDRGTTNIVESVNKTLRPEAFKKYQADKEGKPAPAPSRRR